MLPVCHNEVLFSWRPTFDNRLHVAVVSECDEVTLKEHVLDQNLFMAVARTTGIQAMCCTDLATDQGTSIGTDLSQLVSAGR